MYIIDSPSNNAYFNIASEEYLLEKFPQENLLLLYINAASIIVGKHQNTLAEINYDFVNKEGIKVVRRLSGGGTVYHDLNNLNFSFHSPLDKNNFLDFAVFTKPVIDLLQKLNIPAELKGRNDLEIEGKKFSGNAKLSKNGKMIQHGTILIDSEIEVLGKALKTNPLKYADKATKSVRARVTNLKPYLPEHIDTLQFKKLFIQESLENNPKAEIYTFTEEDIQNIQKLAEEKYSTWDWNYGSSPNYNFKNAKKFPAGFVELHMDVKKGGKIEDLKIFGDFFSEKPIEEFEQFFKGKQHEINVLREVVLSLNLEDYFGNIEREEFLELFY